MAFSDNLQFLRTRQGQTQEQLAEILEVSRQSVSKWESAQSYPEMDTILRICDLYQVDLDTLMRGSVEDSLVEDTAQYDRHMNTFTRQVAGAVGGIILGVAASGLLSLRHEMLAGAFLLLVITVAVVVLVAGGIQHENFCKKHPVIQDFYTQNEKDAFQKKFVWLIAGGVGAILFDVVLLILFFSFFPEREPYESWAGAGFLVIVAGAVMSLIYGGMQHDKYQVWQYNRNNNPPPEAKRRLNLIGTACGVIMTLTAAVYVGLGLSMDRWDRDWWLFAVGGILCGVVAIALNPYKDDD